MDITREQIEVMGKDLVEKTRQIIGEGNVRRIIIKQEGNTIVEFPLTLGVIGAVMAPMLAALGAIAALVTKCTLEIEKKA